MLDSWNYSGGWWEILYSLKVVAYLNFFQQIFINIYICFFVNWKAPFRFSYLNWNFGVSIKNI